MIFSVLTLIAAIKNAKLLNKHHNNPVPSKNAPGTNIFEIFDYLSAYLMIEKN